MGRVAERDDTVRLLRRVEAGDARAQEELFSLLFCELRGLAAGFLDGERTGHTLQPTALVHEAWIRLNGDRAPWSWNDRRHYVRTAARAMRRVLVDHARARAALKRGTREELPDEALDALAGSLPMDAAETLALDQALQGLAELDPALAELVELRFFAGASVAQTAAVLDCSVSHVERRWRLARAWLRRELGERFS